MATVTVRTHYNVVFYIPCLSCLYTLGLKINASGIKFKDGLNITIVRIKLYIQGVYMYISLQY
jgi:hypothetical protein